MINNENSDKISNKDKNQVFNRLINNKSKVIQNADDAIEKG